MPPKPPRGKATLQLVHVFYVNRQPVSVPGRRVSVAGVVRPFVPGQTLLLKAYVGKKLLKQARVRIQPSARRTYGRFAQGFVSPATGYVSVSVTHKASSTLGSFAAKTGYSALNSQIHFGSTGRFVQLVQQRLAALHFFLRQSGVYDGGMGQAIDAYHRLLGWGTSQTLDARTAAALLNGQGDFRIRYPRQGRHAEGWINKQLLALADGSKVQYIFPISSGKPSTPTILGSFHVYVQTPGYLPDGMYYSSFFIGGYAIHGYDPAPDWPASHGCMRTQISVARFIYHWLTVGDAVDTYL
ncbi:MAG: L,D-transpeptidase [Solirubrobacterales bacterium]|nr:L,D-transpeptidase [Solirubrobacterales bacterium]